MPLLTGSGSCWFTHGGAPLLRNYIREMRKVNRSVEEGQRSLGSTLVQQCNTDQTKTTASCHNKSRTFAGNTGDALSPHQLSTFSRLLMT